MVDQSYRDVIRAVIAETAAYGIRFERSDNLAQLVYEGKIRRILQGLATYPAFLAKWLVYYFPQCTAIRLPLLMARGGFDLEQVVNAVRTVGIDTHCVSKHWEGFLEQYRDTANLFMRISWWSARDLRFLSNEDTRKWLDELDEPEIVSLLGVCDRTLRRHIMANLDAGMAERIRCNRKAPPDPDESLGGIAGALIMNRVLNRIIAGVEREEMKMPLPSFNRIPKPDLAKALANEHIFDTHEDDFLADDCHEFLFVGPGRFGDTFMAEMALALPFALEEDFHLFLSQMASTTLNEFIFWILSLGYPRYLKNDHLRRNCVEKMRSYHIQWYKLMNEGLEHDIVDLSSSALRRQNAMKVFVHAHIAAAASHLPETTRNAILAFLKERDASVYRDALTYCWDGFEFIARLSDSDLQVLLRHLDKQTLSLALKGASETVKDNFFINMASEAKRMLANDMEAMIKTSRQSVDKAQASIIRTANRLMVNGLITGYKGVQL